MYASVQCVTDSLLLLLYTPTINNTMHRRSQDFHCGGALYLKSWWPF